MGKYMLIVGAGDASEALTEALQTQPGWEIRWVAQGEQAIETWMHRRPDAVIVSGSLGPETELKLRKVFEACEPGACVFTWVSGKETALVTHIRETFRQRQRERLGSIQVTDILDPGNQADAIRLVS